VTGSIAVGAAKEKPGINPSKRKSNHRLKLFFVQKVIFAHSIIYKSNMQKSVQKYSIKDFLVLVGIERG